MALSPTTEDWFTATIKEMKTNKATGPDSIPTKIFKNNKS